MSIKNSAAALAFAVGCILAFPSASLSASATAIAELSEGDQAEFQRIVDRIDKWERGDEVEFKSIQAEIALLAAARPDFVPVQVEAARLKWYRLTYGFGLVSSSMSMLPVFLELQKMAPDYPKPYILAARAYIFTSDFTGALPSLKKVTALAPEDPKVDLAWALYYSRQIEREKAVAASGTAIPKAGNDAESMVDAITLMCHNNGVHGADAANAVADVVRRTQPDPSFLASVASGVVDRYGNQPGLIDVGAQLVVFAAEKSGATPELLLQWSRIALSDGLRNIPDGVEQLDPAFMRPVEEILSDIKDIPEVAERVWACMRVDVALRKNELDTAESLIAVGYAKDYDKVTLGLKSAALLNAQNKPREVVALYHKLGLPDDRLMMEANARIGGKEDAKRFFFAQVQADPTDAVLLGNFAGFLMHFFKDTAGAIDYGSQAYALMPYPMVQQTLASAYLTLSGEQLRVGSLDAALASFEQATRVGYDEEFVLRLCYKNCEEIQAALTAFR